MSANIATLLDTYYTPKVIKLFDRPRYQINKNLILLILFFVGVLTCTGIIAASLFSETYFHLFFPDLEFEYKGTFAVIASGICFYALRGILRVLSYRFGLIYLQFRIQIASLFLMIGLVFILDSMIEIPGIFLSYLLSSVITVIIYLRLIIPRIRGSWNPRP